MSYYNTNNETGSTLKTSRGKAENQADRVMYHASKEILFSADAMWNKHFAHLYPLTSIRRAITDLSKDGLLVKTDSMATGMYGKKVHQYRITDDQLVLELDN